MRLVIHAAFVAACSTPATDAIDGPAIFIESCALCHGPEGKPDAVMVQRIGVRDLTSPELRARVSKQLVEDQVRNGSRNNLMPAFAGKLTDSQIRAVATWVASPAFPQR